MTRFTEAMHLDAVNKQSMQSPIRVLCAVGPGDVVSAFQDWKEGVRTATETSITYSSQTLNCLVRHGAAFWIVSSHARQGMLREGGNRVENRPKVFLHPTTAWIYHMNLLLYAVSLWWSALRFRATHAVIDSGTTHWFALAIFRLAGIEVVPNFHNTYWPAGQPVRGVFKNAILSMDRLFFRSSIRSALGVSPECRRQVEQLSAGRTKFFGHCGQFVSQDFDKISSPTFPGREVRVMFAGRVERSKGIFDLLRVAEIVATDPEHAFVFEVCGAGADLDTFAALVRSRNLDDRFILRGKLPRDELLMAYGRSHVVIVPTRSDFQEGFALVCAEAVLSRRPFLTCAVVPALEVLARCAVEARTDDPEDYAKKLLELVNNP